MCRRGGRGGPCGTCASSVGACWLALAARVVELGLVLGLRLRRRRVGRVRHRRRRRRHVRLHRRLLATLGGGARLVGARALDVILAARAIPRRPAAAGAPTGTAASRATRAAPPAAAPGGGQALP